MPKSRNRKNHKQAVAKRRKGKTDEMIRKMKFYQEAFGPPKKATIDLHHVDMEFPEGDPLMGEEALTAVLEDIKRFKEESLSENGQVIIPSESVNVSPAESQSESESIYKVDVNLQEDLKPAL